MKIDWFTTLVRHFANVANASDQPTYIGPMLVCCLGMLILLVKVECSRRLDKNSIVVNVKQAY